MFSLSILYVYYELLVCFRIIIKLVHYSVLKLTFKVATLKRNSGQNNLIIYVRANVDGLISWHVDTYIGRAQSKRANSFNGINHRCRNQGTMPSPRFYNFSIEIRFLPYNLTLLSLCAPPPFPDLSALLCSWNNECFIRVCWYNTLLHSVPM